MSQDAPESTRVSPSMPASGAIAFEGSLGIAALTIGAWLSRSPLDALSVRPTSALVGVAAAAAPLAIVATLVKLRPPGLRSLFDRFESDVMPLFSRWTLAELAMVSLAAGLGEELLFRGLLQLELTRWFSTSAAIVLASVAFGLAHPLSFAYVIMAALMGAYLGGLLVATGDLLAPISCHAAYDFGALIWFARRAARRNDDQPTAAP